MTKGSVFFYYKHINDLSAQEITHNHSHSESAKHNIKTAIFGANLA